MTLMLTQRIFQKNQKSKKMKRHIILSLALAVCFSAYAQDKKQMSMGHGPDVTGSYSGKTITFSGKAIDYSTGKSPSDSLLKAVRAAQRGLEANPSSQQAAEKLIKAKVELFALEKKIEAAREKAQSKAPAGKTDPKTQAEREKMEAAKKAMYAAEKDFKNSPDDKARQQDYIKSFTNYLAAKKALEPIVFVDGKQVPSIASVSRDSIKTFKILKNEEAVEKYGEKGRNGVIIITKGAPSPRKSIDEIRIEHLERAIKIKDNQKAEFEKIYKSVNDQIEKLRRDSREAVKKAEGMEAINKIFQTNISIEQKRLEMYKSLGKILSDEQLGKLYKADIQFARNMMSGKYEMRDKSGQTFQGQTSGIRTESRDSQRKTPSGGPQTPGNGNRPQHVQSPVKGGSK